MDRFDLNFLDDYSDEALLDELRRVAGLVGDRTLTQSAFNEGSGKVHPQTVIRRFGGWKEALTKAGIGHRFVQRSYTDQKCFENLAATWTERGRAPEYREMNLPPSRVGAKAYLRWGTWRKALKAFVEWANSAETEPAVPGPISAPRLRVTTEDRHEVPLRLKWRHIVPWADGGKTIMENLQTLCEPCNLGKGRSYEKLI